MENNNYVMRKLEEINKHFKNITIEEFEENLINAGYGEIQSLEESSMELMCEELVESAKLGVYKKQNKNYNFNYQSVSYFNNDTYNTYSEVA